MPTQLSKPEQLKQFLTRLGEACPQPARLYLFGGSALLLMGGQRRTADIDYSVDERSGDEVRRAIAQVAAEMDLDVEESVPAEFTPLPAGAADRHQLIGQFGSLEAFVLDPYSIAVMKIDRAFEADMEDVAFLVRGGHVDLAFLEQCVEDVAGRYDEPIRLRRNFAEFKRGLANL